VGNVARKNASGVWGVIHLKGLNNEIININYNQLSLCEYKATD